MLFVFLVVGAAGFVDIFGQLCGDLLVTGHPNASRFLIGLVKFVFFQCFVEADWTRSYDGGEDGERDQLSDSKT